MLYRFTAFFVFYLYFVFPVYGNKANSYSWFNSVPSPPVFSHPSGFYTEAFEVSISHSNPNVTLYYTLDGSNPNPNALDGRTFFIKNQYEQEPGQTSGPLIPKQVQTQLYTQSIDLSAWINRPNFYAQISTTFDNNPNYIPSHSVFKSVVIRAVAVSTSGEMSAIATANYIISPQGSQRFSLPVTTLSVDPEDWFDYVNGTNVAGEVFDQWRAENPSEVAGLWSHANYWRSGEAWERLAHLSFFENGAKVVNQNVGLRNHGNSTRSMRNRPIRLYARGSYGASTIPHSFFESVGHSSFRRLILRNGGNDAFGTLFRDAVIQDMFSHFNMAFQAWQPTVLFLNGEYWGIYNLRERYDRHYFERHYQIQEGEMDIVENNAEVVEGDATHYQNFLSYLENQSLNTDEAWTHINQTIDVESFVDHYCVNIFSANYDWPQNNIYFWRKKTAQYLPNAPYGHDGRWRWVMRDMDVAFNGSPEWISNAHLFNMVQHTTEANGDPAFNPDWSTFVFRKLLENDTFKHTFINRFADLLNTSFQPAYVLSKIDAAQSVLAPEVEEHIARWSTHSSVADWEQKVDAMRFFATQRPAMQRQHLMQKFELDTATIRVSVNQPNFGYVKVNSIDITSDTPGILSTEPDWVGIYFKNVPITVRAVAQPGYVFHHWTGINHSFDPEITVTLTQNAQLRAHFVLDTNTVVVPEILNFWALNTQLPNDTPLTQLAPTYSKTGVEAQLHYYSCFEGYPFFSGHPLWRRASMERRNQPTNVNYAAEGNYSIPFAQANIRGVQIKQPLQSDGRANHLILQAQVEQYHELQFSFAVINEGAADKLHFSYTTNSDEGWQELTEFSTDLTPMHQRIQIDLTDVFDPSLSNTFWLKIDFEASNPTEDLGNRVTFNNFMLTGIPLLSQIEQEAEEPLLFYPNPNYGVVFLNRSIGLFSFECYDVTGRKVKSGSTSERFISIEELPRGTYILKILQEQNERIFKMIRR